MAGRSEQGPITEPEFVTLLNVLVATNKGRAFLQEYRLRCQPGDNRQLLDALARIEAAMGAVRDTLHPDAIAAELQHLAMTLDIALDGAADAARDGTLGRRLALIRRARHEIDVLATSFAGRALDQDDAAR